MDIQFDKNGLITPKEIIELPLADFERIFVKERKEKKHRQQIFDEYLRYNEQIQKEVGAILFQFVNGSFTTLKAKPKDIDVVSFIDYRIYRYKENEIDYLMQLWKGMPRIDGFITVRSYPGHPHFMLAQLRYEYWKDLFMQTNPKYYNKNFKKGLIKIKFDEK